MLRLLQRPYRKDIVAALRVSAYHYPDPPALPSANSSAKYFYKLHESELNYQITLCKCVLLFKLAN